jgi:hypothetical protein
MSKHFTPECLLQRRSRIDFPEQQRRMRPNQALERTAARRVNLLLMTATDNIEALRAVVGGRSAWSR